MSHGPSWPEGGQLFLNMKLENRAVVFKPGFTFRPEMVNEGKIEMVLSGFRCEEAGSGRGLMWLGEEVWGWNLSSFCQ